MSYKNRRSTYSSFILFFVAIKIALNLLAISHFGFHRDELLHLALGDHLDWGYKEVPPFIALLARITSAVFGNSLFASRIFTTICSGLIIWLTGQITVELGGKKFAIALACLALIFSPSFAASGYLFQPVVFDQFWWVLVVWLIIKYFNTSSPIYVYLLGAAIGLGMLTKYTMAFFSIALVIGILIGKQRKVLLNKHIAIAVAIAFLIFLPNLIWQFAHHLPVITHMKTLQKTQLEYLSPGDFIKQQLVVNGASFFIWFLGFAFLIFSFRMRRFQFLAFAYIFVFIFLLVMNGKNYYLFGAYPMLFAAGGCGWERLINSRAHVLRATVAIVFIAPNLILLPLVLPIFPLDQTLALFRYAQKNLSFLNFATKWEDQQQHATTQDYGDMFGWDEMARKVAGAYYNLTPEQRKNTQIYADNYGEAGAIHHFGKQYALPEVACLNSSFTLWAPENLNAKYIIYVDDQGGGNVKKFESIVGASKKIGEVTYPLAREKGTAIFLITDPKPSLNDIYRRELAQKRLE